MTSCYVVTNKLTVWIRLLSQFVVPKHRIRFRDDFFKHLDMTILQIIHRVVVDIIDPNLVNGRVLSTTNYLDILHNYEVAVLRKIMILMTS